MANESSDIESPMEHVILHNSDRPTVKEQLQICCKPTYNIRKLRSKGAIVLLIGNYFVYSLFYYLVGNSSGTTVTQYYYYITWGLTIPVFGWLADVHIGRHKMIRWGTWITWLALMLATASSVIARSYNYHYNNTTTIVLFTIASAGSGGYQANVIQYGLDQLHDASTDEITSFISWYVCVCLSSGIVMEYMNIYVHKEYPLLVKLLMCANLSIGLVLFLLSDNLLIKEPVTQNPFKLVYRVIKYAIKNKRPRCRSAFTYCEDELPSRIDLGKRKYGGPFTTERVEDVKTFIRLSIVLFFGCAIPSLVIGVNQLSNQIENHIGRHTSVRDTVKLYRFYIPITKYTAAAFIIPIYEFIFYPILRKHFSWVQSHNKLLLGVLLQMARVMTLVGFMLKATHSSFESDSYNTTTKCIFQEFQNYGPLKQTFNDKWMILPHTLNSLSIATLAIGSIEFICAQTPYSMRGLMFGMAYGIAALFAFVEYGILYLFTKTSFTWGTGLISCGFWYLLLKILFLGIDGIMIVILSRWYKKRKREDILPNEQIFAERYYTKYGCAKNTTNTS